MTEEQTKITLRYMGCDEIMKGAIPDDSLERARQAYLKENFSGLIDPITHRQMQDWSCINGLVVGAEDLPYSRR